VRVEFLADQQLIESIIKGCLENERKAQMVLFDRYKSLISRMVLRIFSNAEKTDIEDTVQQVYIELFKSLRYFRGEASFDTWVYRICTKVCMTRLRMKYRKKEQIIAQARDVLVDELPNQNPAPDLAMQAKAVADRIQKSLLQLSPERCMAFVLCEIEGRDLEEAARIVGVPIGTVKSRLFRAREDLRHMLKDVMA
jgi:RNA polymerase sigma-70 factor, ECF subfamily